MNTIKILKSSNAVIVVLVLALLAQMPHAQYVLYARSREHDWFGMSVTAIGAIALEMAVLVFAVRGNVRVSWGFAAFSTCVNLIYYYETTASLWTPANWLLSVGLPVAIALYSHEVMEPLDESAQQVEHKPVNKRVTRTVRATQTVEQSEQFDEQSEQYDIIEPDASTHALVAASTTQADHKQVGKRIISNQEQVKSLDEVDEKILNAITNGASTPYAIAKAIGVAQTTLKRKSAEGIYIGRLPALVQAGHLLNGGTTYSLADNDGNMKVMLRR